MMSFSDNEEITHFLSSTGIYFLKIEIAVIQEHGFIPLTKLETGVFRGNANLSLIFIKN